MSLGIWNVLQSMRGKYLLTLGQKKKFQIASIEPYEVIIRPIKQRKPRLLSRECVQEAWKHLIFHREISLEEIKNKYSRFSAPYLAAILATMPDVSYSTNPIVLKINRNHQDEHTLKQEQQDIVVKQ